MKHLLIALIAFALTLGVACKKETNELNVKSSTEQKAKVDKADLNVDVKQGVDGGGGVTAPTPTDGGYGGYPGGEFVYPHVTGGCYCGKYAVCHPVTPYVHSSTCKIGQPVPGNYESMYGCTCLK